MFPRHTSIFQTTGKTALYLHSVGISRVVQSQIRDLSSEGGSKPSVKLNNEDVKESFIKGSGPGGQKINKVRNCVLLHHIPTGIQVRCQDSRDIQVNRAKARNMLLLKVDLHLNQQDSKLGKKFDKLRKKKDRARRRAMKKYTQSTEGQRNEKDTKHDHDDP
mmetsp:Transcript_10296/g.15499  ORF Transcript_10296/g.15499 Transcript_10296/m.15499 type:complete len:162 (-) Transcript_10296:53-538(-)